MITLKEIAPYLPYKLKAVLTYDHCDDYSCEDYFDEKKFCKGAIWIFAGYADGDLCIPLGEGEIEGFIYRNEFTYACFGNGIKPLFRPLDLTKEIEIEGKKIVPGEVLSEIIDENDLGYNDHYYDYSKEKYVISNPLYEPHCIVQKLFEWHFDVFGLIERGDGIDINTL